MGFKIGRSGDAPVLETKRTVRFGEQKVVATETPVATEREEVVDAPDVDGTASEPAEKKSVKAKRGRKAKS